MSKIPRIIHQLWIGEKPAPVNQMNTWKEKNPEFQYIMWNEAEIQKRGLIFQAQEKIDTMEEINGKADIMRWEILYKYGGIFQDADSICISPIDENLMQYSAFIGWENEEERPDLLATGTMAFPPQHKLPKMAIEWILSNNVSKKTTKKRAWETVGPGLLTKIYKKGLFNDIKILPSYYFLPIHCTGVEYSGHGKIYAYQEWSSTKNNYDDFTTMAIPGQFFPLPIQVSILICSFNTKAVYLKECLESIKAQIGNFKIELVWINDGSNEINTKILKNLLNNFEKTTRFINIKYIENQQNQGVAYSLHKGVNLCSNELIIRMDSDDIMIKDRCLNQITYMLENPSIQICGGQITYKSNNYLNNKSTRHPSITWNEYTKNPKHWIANHATLCFRKNAILEIGNYSLEHKQMIEDLNLELRFLKKYKYLHNLSENLIVYRIHDEQVTRKNNDEWNEIRNKMISSIINE